MNLEDCPLCNRKLISIKDNNQYDISYCTEVAKPIDNKSFLFKNRGTPDDLIYHFSIRKNPPTRYGHRGPVSVKRQSIIQNIVFDKSVINIFDIIIDYYSFSVEKNEFVHIEQFYRETFDPIVGPNLEQDIQNYLIMK